MQALLPLFLFLPTSIMYTSDLVQLGIVASLSSDQLRIFLRLRFVSSWSSTCQGKWLQGKEGGISNVISTVRLKPKKWSSCEEKAAIKKAIIAATPTDPWATCISIPNDYTKGNCFVVNVLFQWWLRGCSAWPWVASLTQPGARHLNQMALSQVWKLLFLHVINVLFFWLISCVDWKAFAFVINGSTASYNIRVVWCVRSLVCARLPAYSVPQIPVQSIATAIGQAGRYQRTLGFSTSASLWCHYGARSVGFPASVNFWDKEKEADTDSGLTCDVSSRLIYKSTNTDPALVPWVQAPFSGMGVIEMLQTRAAHSPRLHWTERETSAQLDETHCWLFDV